MKLNKLFVLSLSGLFFLMYCGKPTDPEYLDIPDISGGYKIVSKFQTSAYTQDVFKKENLLYIAQGEGGLEIVDASDPENLQMVSITTENVRAYSSRVDMYDSVVYLAAGSYGVTVVDAANPLEPYVTVSNSSLKPAKNLFVFGELLFTAVSEQGVKIADISYPTHPDNRGEIETAGFAYGLTITSDSNYMMVACGEMGLYIHDISDFENVSPQIAWCNTPGKAENVVILEEESIAFMACGTAGLQIIDYSDTLNVHIVGSFDYGGYAKDLIYRDHKIFMTTELSGLHIIDVSDVTNPTFIGKVDTEYALGLDMDDNYIYVADEDEGIIVISFPE